MRAGIAIDRWKKDIFERHLKQAGYTWDTMPGFTPDTMFLKVVTSNPMALQEVVKAAYEECKKTGAPK